MKLNFEGMNKKMIAQYFDIIILLIVVLVVFQKLKNLLGTRPEAGDKAKAEEENAIKIFDLLMKEAEKNASEAEKKSIVTEIVDETNISDIDKILNKIPTFNRVKFIDGAKKAFEVIIEAFAKGDTKTLEMLINKNLYKKFQEIIEKRHAEGIIAETDFIGFDKAEIINAKISKNEVAKISVEFISEQVNLLKNSKDEVIEGDENFIQKISDIWTFEKSLTSTNPNWMLVSTKK